MSTFNLLDAIRVVKDNERIASLNYGNAARTLKDAQARRLFEELSEFENYHYERLLALEKSLEEDGKFITYTGNKFPQPPVFEIRAAQNPGKKSLMQIVTEARDLEKEAENAYANLAMQIDDPQGHAMFVQLAEEEHVHYRILSDAYWKLNNLGEWAYAGPRK